MRMLIPLLLASLGLWLEGAAGGGGTDATSGGGARPPEPSDGDKAAAGGAKPPAGEPDAKEGDDDQLGEGGKAALTAERRKAREAEERAKAAEGRLAELEAAGQSESQRAIAQAKREATAEANAKWEARVREAEVRGALRGAGIANERFLDLAVAAPEFRRLKVDAENGTVEGVAEAMAEVKKAYPEAFVKPTPPKDGAYDGAAGASGNKEPATLEEAINQHYQEQQRSR